jgi:hypothetical protein
VQDSPRSLFIQGQSVAEPSNSSDITWGQDFKENYDEVLHNGEWFMHQADWEAMMKTFSPPPPDSEALWNMTCGQDPENLDDNVKEEDEEDITAGTF